MAAAKPEKMHGFMKVYSFFTFFQPYEATTYCCLCYLCRQGKTINLSEELKNKVQSKNNNAMISEKLVKAINKQIAAEMWSANMYLSMSYFLKKEGYDGFAHWLKKQSLEEMEHAYGLSDYVVSRGGSVVIGNIDEVPLKWESVAALFKNVYEHECKVSALIDELVDVASGLGDKASEDFLQGYVREQVEEEATSRGIMERVNKADCTALFFLDEKMSQRA